MSDAEARGRLLIAQGKFDLAEKELRRSLSEDPDSGLTHSLLALCLAAQDRITEAYRSAERGVQLDPASPFSHYAMGLVNLSGNRHPEAEAAARRAIELDPDDPDYRSLLARTFLVRGDWRNTLEAAEEGLKLFAEHEECTNLRAMALTKLGRTEEASQDIETALQQNPEDGLAHANRGWLFLHQGKGREGIVHFREALRIDPTDEYARAGLVEALKSRHRIYGFFLACFLWLTRFSSKGQFWIIIGAFLLFRLLRTLAKNNPALAPYVIPIIALYVAFFLFSWFGKPFFNLILRFDKEGRRALSPAQTAQTNVFALLFGAGTAAIICYFSTRSLDALAFATCFYGLLFPSMSLMECEPGRPRRIMAFVTGGMALLGAAMVAGILLRRPESVTLLYAFLACVFLSQFVGPLFASSLPRR
ncbi:MAG TPA: tetratricopeptide repeat protein [Planctomycetota bacterium]|nr:tetratricopeptide repeat protein [Planctomycetota bacterium]